MTHVALVDDDIEFLDELAEYLSGRGFRVAACHRPGLAWRFVRRERPEALLLDFDMPGVSGLQVLERLRETSETSAIPVLLLTAHDHPRVRSVGWSKRLDDFIPKGTDRLEIELRLKRAVERFRERQAYVSDTGLPAGPGARNAFSRALQTGSADAGGVDSVFALQLPGFASLAASDRGALYTAYQAVCIRLAHRVRDGLRRKGASRLAGESQADSETLHPVCAWQESAGRFFYYSERSMGPTPPAVDEQASQRLEAVRRVSRLVAAANRLLAALSPGEPSYLALQGQRLVRRRLPAFQLHEFRFRGRVDLSVDRLMEFTGEALAASEEPQAYRLHDF